MNDHHEFLDSLLSDPERYEEEGEMRVEKINQYDRPLYILLPFMMSLDIYKDLTNSSTRRQALTDFRAFLKYNGIYLSPTSASNHKTKQANNNIISS